MHHTRSNIIKASHPHDIVYNDVRIPCFIRLEEVRDVTKHGCVERWEIIFETPKGRILLEGGIDNEALATSLWLGYTTKDDEFPPLDVILSEADRDDYLPGGAS